MREMMHSIYRAERHLLDSCVQIGCPHGQLGILLGILVTLISNSRRQTSRLPAPLGALEELAVNFISDTICPGLTLMVRNLKHSFVVTS